MTKDTANTEINAGISISAKYARNNLVFASTAKQDILETAKMVKLVDFSGGTFVISSMKKLLRLPIMSTTLKYMSWKQKL